MPTFISRCRFLRSEDRRINKTRYPHLSFPEVYVMAGGYKDFYSKFPVSYTCMFVGITCACEHVLARVSVCDITCLCLCVMLYDLFFMLFVSFKPFKRYSNFIRNCASLTVTNRCYTRIILRTYVTSGPSPSPGRLAREKRTRENNVTSRS